MAVDPDRVVAVPVSRNPNIIIASGPITGAVEVIGLIADADTDRERIRDAAYAKQYCKN